jgi:hypothetical protein
MWHRSLFVSPSDLGSIGSPSRGRQGQLSRLPARRGPPWRHAGSDTRSRRRPPEPRLRSEPTNSLAEVRSWSHWGATRGALWCPVRREDRRLEDPKGKPLEAMCRTPGRRVMSCAGVGQLPARFNAIVPPRTCSGMAQLAAHDGAQGREEPGLPLSSFSVAG